MSRTAYDRTASEWPSPQHPGRDGFAHRTVVGELMTRETAAIGPRTGLVGALAALRRHDRDLLPVVDAQDRLLGTATARELLTGLLRPRHHVGAVGELTLRPARTAQADDNAVETCWDAVHDGVERLLVVDGAERLVGTVGLRALLGAVCRDDDAIRSEVLFIAVAHRTGSERPALVVDCREGRVTLKATTTWRSQADALLERVRAVEGIAELDDDLSWELDDTSNTATTQCP